MAGHAQDVQVAVADFECEQNVEPAQRHRAVDVEEVDGQHARGLGAQELACFAVSVDHVLAAAQAARTARVSCGVACSGHGLRNLAAMMTWRSLMVMSS
jgi:hypothetical protein